MKRAAKFTVTVSKTVEVTLDHHVLSQGMADDNPILGAGASLEDVVRHLAYNLVGNGLRLSEIDGYANLPDDMASVPWVDWDVELEGVVDVGAAGPTPGRDGASSVAPAAGRAPRVTRSRPRRQAQ